MDYYVLRLHHHLEDFAVDLLQDDLASLGFESFETESSVLNAYIPAKGYVSGKERVDALLDSVEGRGKGFGRTELDAPEIDNQIILRKIPSGMKPGMLARALVRSAEAYDITADLTARKEE